MLAALAARLRAALGPDAVLDDPVRCATYDCDGLTAYRVTPALVVLPRDTAQVAEVVRACHQAGVPFVARGSGTGLSGGALPRADGVLVVTTAMNEIVRVDLDDERATVAPGVINLEVTRAVAADGYYYAPDPSSQQICSIGGNVAENSGGAHCLKYGFTTNHVTAATVVTPDGEVETLGGAAPDPPGYDLLGAFVGAEGTLGIATEVTLRLLRSPEAVRTLLAGFESTDAAGAVVSEIIAAGILPAAIEMMDALAIEAAEAAVHCGYPSGAGAVLIVECDGPADAVEQESAQVLRLCAEHGATGIRTATDPAQRALIWRGRKSAFAAVGRISPAYIVQDGVVPRTALPEVLRAIGELSRASGVRVANVFHAGDGNLHPLVLFDNAVAGQAEQAEVVSGAILDLCVAHGGSITGEHGVGVDKMAYLPRMFTAEDLDTMQLLRCAFDPAGLCNPGKVFPTPRLCGEVPGHRTGPHPAQAHGLAEVFEVDSPGVSSVDGAGVSSVDGAGVSNMDSVAAARRALDAACGEQWVRPGAAGDEVAGRRPALVASPASTEQVAAVLRVASGHRLAVVARGAGTKLDWAEPPHRVDLVVRLDRLDRVLEHAPGDLVLRTEAGAGLAAVQRRCAEAGQMLALDPLVPGGTVGGALASNSSGPRRLRYGTARDLLIGLTFVRADGTVAHSGGRVVKNVAGYDLGKLFLGSYGTLGLITEAVFRLHPLPREHAVVRLELPGAAAVIEATADEAAAAETAAVIEAAVIEAAARVRRSPLAVSAVELDWPGPGAGLTLAILVESPGDVAARAAKVADLLGPRASITPGVPDWWGTPPWPADGTAVKLSARLSRLGTVLESLRHNGSGLELAVRGSLGAGVLYAGLPAHTAPDRVIGFVAALRAALPPADGHVVVLRSPVTDGLDRWGPVNWLALMHRVKQQFDPGRLLAPGRMAGGI